MPSSPNLFLVSHADGTIVVYDKDREDGVFTPQTPTASLASPPRPLTKDPTPFSPEGSLPAGEWNPLDSIFVTIPPWHPVNAAGAQAGGGRGDRDKATKNPVSHWKVSKRGVVGAYYDLMKAEDEFDLSQTLFFHLTSNTLRPSPRMAACE